MKKKITTKLLLKRETLMNLDRKSILAANGGEAGTGACGPYVVTLTCICTGGGICALTQGACDMPTIGHDDGPYCISKDPKAWCGGIG